MSIRLDETAVIAGLKTLQGWQLVRDDEQRPVIEKDYLFTSFNAAFAGSANTWSNIRSCTLAAGYPKRRLLVQFRMFRIQN